MMIYLLRCMSPLMAQSRQSRTVRYLVAIGGKADNICSV